MAGHGRNIFERAWDAISMRPQAPEPPPQERAVQPSAQVDQSSRGRYRVERGRITQERQDRLDTLTATVPRENLDRLTAAETKEYLEAHMRSLTEMRDLERQVVEQRYGRGIVGRFNEWLHETDAGRVVKIGGKIVGGVGVATAAGMMTGGVGLLLAPLATMMGRKYAVSGLVEAAQWLWPARGERTRRLNLEAARADRATLETQAQNLRAEFDAGRLTPDQLRAGVLDVMQQIRDNENRILQQDREYEEVRTNNMRVRGYVSTGASIVMGATMGINFGIQDLDHNGVAHSVKGYVDGIFWHQNQQTLAFGNWWETVGQRMAHVATGEYGPLAGAPGDLVRAGGEFAARAAAGGNVSMGAFMPDQLGRMIGGLGIAAVGMIGATLREAGSFAGGSRREIQRLLRENIRVEDGDMRAFRGAGRSTTGIERARASTTAVERARPTTRTERARITTTTERPPEEQPERSQPIVPEPAPEETEMTTVFNPLTPNEIRNTANSQELASLILTRLGGENIPPQVSYPELIRRYDVLRNGSDQDTQDAMDRFIADSAGGYAPFAKQQRDTKLEILRRILTREPTPPSEPTPQSTASTETETRLLNVLQREDFLVQPNNLRGIVLERIGAGRATTKGVSQEKFDRALNEWLTNASDTDRNRVLTFIRWSRGNINSIEGLPDDDDQKVVQKNLDMAKTILQSLETGMTTP